MKISMQEKIERLKLLDKVIQNFGFENKKQFSLLKL